MSMVLFFFILDLFLVFPFPNSAYPLVFPTFLEKQFQITNLVLLNSQIYRSPFWSCLRSSHSSPQPSLLWVRCQSLVPLFTPSGYSSSQDNHPQPFSTDKSPWLNRVFRPLMLYTTLAVLPPISARILLSSSHLSDYFYSSPQLYV